MRVVAGLTLASRVAGLVRDGVCARVFGLGAIWSAFSVAFIVPNTFRRLFGEGALSAAFVPEYAQLLKHDPQLARRFASAVFAALITLLGVITLVGELALLYVLEATRVGESGGMAIRLTMIMLPYMPLVCAAAILGGMMQTHGVFAPTAASPIILNLFTIAAASAWAWGLGATPEAAIFAVSWSVTLSGVAQLAWSLAALRRHEQWTRVFAGVGVPFRRLLRRVLPVVIGLGALQISTLVDGLIASWPVVFGPDIHLPGLGAIRYPLDEASAAALFFAQRIYQFPLGVFGVALATVALPALARDADEPERFASILRRGVRSSLFIGLPATIGLIAVRRDLVAVVLGGGRFDLADVDRASGVLLGYLPAVWAYMLAQTVTRSFYARGDTPTPMRLSLLSVGANFLLNLALIWPLREAGLAWATAITSTAQCVALCVIAHRRALPVRLFDDEVRRSMLWSGGLALVMGAVLVGVGLLWPRAESFSDHLLRLVATVSAGATVYFVGARVARRAELRWMTERDATTD